MSRKYEEGDRCPYGDCDGTLEYPPVENCSCHIVAPCSACTDSLLTCKICGWVNDGSTILNHRVIQSLTRDYENYSASGMTVGQLNELIDQLREYNKKIRIENEHLRYDNKRLTKIVEAPWQCDVCGNYIGNSSAVLD